MRWQFAALVLPDARKNHLISYFLLVSISHRIPSVNNDGIYQKDSIVLEVATVRDRLRFSMFSILPLLRVTSLCSFASELSHSLDGSGAVLLQLEFISSVRDGTVSLLHEHEDWTTRGF